MSFFQKIAHLLKVGKFPAFDPSNDRVGKPPARYLQRLDGFCGLLSECMALSRRYGSYASPTNKHFWGSLLFTALCTRACSLAFVAPYSRWAKRDFEHWDFASTANIARTILDTRLTFFYLCAEECTPDQWNCRWNAFSLHDCLARIALRQASPNMGGDEESLDALNTQAEELRERLRNTATFGVLERGTQKRILQGKQAHLEALEDIAVRAGIELAVYRWLWKLMSAQVHAYPYSFYRMYAEASGRGVQTKMEEQHTTLMLSFCMTLLVRSRDEFKKLMQEIESQPRRPVTA